MNEIKRTYSGDQAYLQASDAIYQLAEQKYITDKEAKALLKNLDSKLKARGIETETI